MLLAYRNGKAPQIPPADTGTPSMSTFFSDSPDSPINWGSNSTFHNASQDLGNSYANEHGPAASKQEPLTAAPDAQVAPWLSADSSASNGGVDNGTFYDDKLRKPTQSYDVADPMFYNSDRRPSMASATTVSSQNSVPVSRASTSRGNQNKRLGAFFGDEGLDSSRSSDTGIVTTGRDHSTSSQSRKARHNSVQTNNTDGRGSSPASSRPRSPLPSSDVTPWLFQDFKVSARDGVCPCATCSMHVCPTMCIASAWLIVSSEATKRLRSSITSGANPGLIITMATEDGGSVFRMKSRLSKIIHLLHFVDLFTC